MLTPKSFIQALPLGLAAALFSCAAVTAAQAVPTPITVIVDETGHLTAIMPRATVKITGSLKKDPGPGGLAQALTYASPLGSIGVTPGDLQLQDGTGGPIGDLLRFNAARTGGPTYPASLVFYSDNDDRDVSVLADTGLPDMFQGNVKTIPEVGKEGGNGATYTPTSGEPGFVPNLAITYKIISDPEPSSLWLALSGLVALGMAYRPRGRR